MAQEEKVPSIVNGHDSRSHLSTNVSHHGRRISNITSSIVKLRGREGQRVDLGRSLKGHLWMVDGGWWYTFP